MKRWSLVMLLVFVLVCLTSLAVKSERYNEERKAAAALAMAEKTSAQEQFDKDLLFAEKLTGASCSDTLVMVVWPPAQLLGEKPRVVIAGHRAETFTSMNVTFDKNREGGIGLTAEGGLIAEKIPTGSKSCQLIANYHLRHPNN